MQDGKLGIKKQKHYVKLSIKKSFQIILLEYPQLGFVFVFQ